MALGCQRRDADEVLHRVVRHLAVEMRIGHVRGRVHHDHVAVRRALRHDVGTDDAGCAAAVVDDELLADVLGHFLHDHAARDVVRAAGRPGNDHPYRLDRVILGESRHRQRHGARQREQRQSHGVVHDSSPGCVGSSGSMREFCGGTIIGDLPFPGNLGFPRGVRQDKICRCIVTLSLPRDPRTVPEHPAWHFRSKASPSWTSPP